MSAPEKPAPPPPVSAPPVSPAHPLEHPARPDDLDHGKVALSYDGVRLPLWVVIPWIVFLAWGAAYLVAYLSPTAGAAH